MNQSKIKTTELQKSSPPHSGARIDVIVKVLAQAHLNKSNPESFDWESDIGKLLIESWMKQLKDIPTKHLDDLYTFSEGFKNHSNMVTPADMIKAWKNEYQATVRRLEQKETLQLPSAGESKQILDNVYKGLFDEYGGFTKVMALVKSLNKQAETDDRFSLIRYPENLMEKVWNDEKGCFIYASGNNQLNCEHEAPPAYYNWKEDNSVLCCYCLEQKR